MKTKKRLLIAGGGYADIPLILSGKQLGFHVITSGNRPDEAGHAFSDEYCKADFSDIEQILDISSKCKVDAVCSCCNDFSELSVAYTAEKLNLPGHDSLETLELIHHKDRYREFAMANDIPSPRAAGFSSPAAALRDIGNFRFPVIIKPVDLTGGKGVSTVNIPEDEREAVEKAFAISKSGRIVIEEFITGTRHGFSAFLINKKVKFFFTDNENYYINPYLVSGAYSPGEIPETAIQSLIQNSEKIANILSLKDGIFHVQFILTESGPVIIEICRRAPGDLYISLVEYAAGVNYPEWIVRASAGLDLSMVSQPLKQKFFLRHCVMASSNGNVKNIKYSNEIKDNVFKQLMWGGYGYEITDFLTQKLGIIFLEFQSHDEMFKKSQIINDLIKVEMSI